MFEWNAIDLHLHTKQGIDRKKRPDNVDFDFARLLDAVKSNHLKLIAITNHNKVFFAQYLVIKYLLSRVGVNTIMGVEIDTNKDFQNTIDGTKERHLIILFKDKFIDNFLTARTINSITDTKCSNDEIFFNGNDIFGKIIQDKDAIIVPHGEKHKGYLQHPTTSELNEVIHKQSKGFFRVFDQKTDWEYEKLKQALSKNMENDSLVDIFSALFTDTRLWDEYVHTGFVINSEPTYEGFAQATFNPKYRFSIIENVVEPPNYISKIEIYRKENSNSQAIIPTTLNLSPRYNCVIGKSGTGKSLLSFLIQKKLNKNFVYNDNYSFSNDYEIKIYNQNGLELNSTNFFWQEGINLFNQIIRVMDSQSKNVTSIAKVFKPTFIPRKQIDLYLEDYSTKIKEYISLVTKKKTISELLSTAFGSLANNISSYIANESHIKLKVDVLSNKYVVHDEHEDDLKMSYIFHLNALRNELEKFKKFSIYHKEISEMLSFLEICFRSIDHNKNKCILKDNYFHKKVEIFNDSLAKINGVSSAKAEEAIKAQEAINKDLRNICDYAIKIYLLKLKIHKFDLSINLDNLSYEETLNENLKIIIRETLDVKHFKEFDPQHNCLFKTHGFTTKIKKETYNLSISDDAKALFDNYIEVGVINELTCSQFGKDTEKLSGIFEQKMTIDDQDILKLNPGSLAKTYIKYYFETELKTKNPRPNLVVFDQIENDVDKEYISGEIKDYIESLKGIIQVIVITHDPIVAVNADPNNYILASKSNRSISYESFTIESDEVRALKNISKTVDGSIGVLKKRYFIYERGEENDDLIIQN